VGKGHLRKQRRLQLSGIAIRSKLNDSISYLIFLIGGLLNTIKCDSLLVTLLIESQTDALTFDLSRDVAI